MGLSEPEIAARLAALRLRREALDREIADLVLYLELGRRLGAVGMEPPGSPGPAGQEAGLAPDTGSWPEPAVAAPPRDATPVGPGGAPRASPEPRASRGSALPGGAYSESGSQFRSEDRGAAAAIPPAIPFAEDVAGARRYGRAVVEAARGAIAEAGRPLHAAEILAVLHGRGFTVPGRDPVAALNTRLWKRSGPGGPLRRVGEATYALAEPA
ncbi:winged helix-turn-helix domain-containing protein [Methylobacterium sp. J-070]|uniref:winged helix-turn-helix domain-containing protein n=1 Tax=Methylobacterium sp. J-070 TaxID=2836650 RepID=UPI001FB9A34C|nr:winged helix-turn-helix domain-containing protein [Methylobacterium sp. J-070]MCJ2050510.1 winged helix-turn-helix domain-containing protein [Methylobacterium sp. J-070]